AGAAETREGAYRMPVRPVRARRGLVDHDRHGILPLAVGLVRQAALAEREPYDLKEIRCGLHHAWPLYSGIGRPAFQDKAGVAADGSAWQRLRERGAGSS